MSLQIRRHVYRDREGWLICGRNQYSGIFGTQVFIIGARADAERVRAKLNRGEQLTVDDFRAADGACPDGA